MKFKRLKSFHKSYFPFIKNEQFQLNINILICSIWKTKINFLFLNAKRINHTLFSSKNKIRNYCIVSGRANNVKKKFWTSRIQIQNLSTKRMLCGLRKSSW